jgi:hypothetical protein
MKAANRVLLTIRIIAKSMVTPFRPYEQEGNCKGQTRGGLAWQRINDSRRNSKTELAFRLNRMVCRRGGQEVRAPQR